MRRTRNPKLCQSAVRERLAKYVKCKASLLYFYFYFFPDSLTEVTRAWILAHNGSKYALWCKEVPFWSPHDGQHFGVEIPPKPSKMAFSKHVWASANGLKTNDVIKDWRLGFLRRSLDVVGRAAYTISSIMGIAPVSYFQWLQRNDSVSWCTIFGTEIQFLHNLCSICRPSVLQVVA